MWAGYFIRCCCWCPGVQHHGQTAPAGLRWHQRDWGLLLEAPLCCCMWPRKLTVLPAAESPARSGLQAYEGREGGRMSALPWGRVQNPHVYTTPPILLHLKVQGQHLSCGHTTSVVQATDIWPCSSQFSSYCAYLEAARFIGALGRSGR